MQWRNVKCPFKSTDYIVTRFGKISPLWTFLKSLAIFEGLDSNWENLESAHAHFYTIGQIYVVVNCQILNK